jgi:mono/diheme cytochrome c family protein
MVLKMMKFGLPALLSLVVLGLTLGSDLPGERLSISGQTSLQEVLELWGEPAPKHKLAKIDPEMVKRGEEIVKRGRTIGPDGKKSRYVSKYYTCTACHNVVQEDPQLSSRDPEARLDYARENNLPFLQGTTFHGMVNRESWYNDDYEKKYGDLVKAARFDLKESIQLCATECAQGRLVNDWEMEAILSYFWSLEFKLEDLDFHEDELHFLRQKPKVEEERKEVIDWIKSRYLQTSPAHFGDAPKSKVEGYPGLPGDPVRGEALYKLSCLHCHAPEKEISGYLLDESPLSLKHLQKNMFKDSHFSLYQIIRYGTYALPGHRPYMPHYPLERMSDQQVEDLRAYIEKESGGA